MAQSNGKKASFHASEAAAVIPVNVSIRKLHVSSSVHRCLQEDLSCERRKLKQFMQLYGRKGMERVPVPTMERILQLFVKKVFALEKESLRTLGVVAVPGNVTPVDLENVVEYLAATSGDDFKSSLFWQLAGKAYLWKKGKCSMEENELHS